MFHNILINIIYFFVFISQGGRKTRPVGIEPTTSGFGNLRSTD